jgi:hypothetical protein
MPADRKAINKKYYGTNDDARLLKNTITSILAGRRPCAKTLKRFDLGERELINRIRSLDARYRTILEYKHGVDLESLYKGKTPLPEMRLPDMHVIEAAPPPKYDYPQGLEEVPAKGLNIPINWEMLMTFWSGTVRVHEMGSNAAHITTFKQVMDLFDQKQDQNDIPTLRNANEVMIRLALANQKSDVAIEADRTVQDESKGVVAGADDDDDEEVRINPVAKSKAGAKVRQRDKRSALKNITPTYGNKLASTVSTFLAWKVFRDSLGTDVMNQYQGTFGEGEVGINVALAANQKVQSNKTKNELRSIPSYELIKSYLPKI